MTTITLGRRSIDISNPEKVLFPADGITKADLADYYRDVADAMLPHMRGRPVTMHRFPNGIADEGFLQKQVSGYFPEWIARATVRKAGGKVTHVICEDAATLVYLAGQACITMHLWPSRADEPEHPDRLIFDLDPSADDFAAVRRTARLLGDILEEIGLVPFVMTTGSKGLHIVVPLDRSEYFDAVRAFAGDVSDLLMRRDPDCCTSEHRKARRGERIFVDIGRNAYAQHGVAPYSIRPKAGAPVATPLDWRELEDDKLDAQRYNIGNVRRRLSRKGDPWETISRRARSLTKPRRALDRLLAESTPD